MASYLLVTAFFLRDLRKSTYCQGILLWNIYEGQLLSQNTTHRYFWILLKWSCDRTEFLNLFNSRNKLSWTNSGRVKCKVNPCVSNHAVKNCHGDEIIMFGAQVFLSGRCIKGKFENSARIIDLWAMTRSVEVTGLTKLGKIKTINLFRWAG